jgi:hypothetical protein
MEARTDDAAVDGLITDIDVMVGLVGAGLAPGSNDPPLVRERGPRQGDQSDHQNRAAGK